MRASHAPERTAAELLSNASDCEEIAARLLDVVEALDAGRVFLLDEAGERQRQRLTVAAATFTRVAERSREWAEELEP